MAATRRLRRLHLVSAGSRSQSFRQVLRCGDKKDPGRPAEPAAVLVSAFRHER
jgi:hypothetical protein